MGTDRLAVDFGLDGTVDARFARSRFDHVQISAAGGNDGIASMVPASAVCRSLSTGGGGAGVGREIVLPGDGNDRFVSSLNAFVGARTDVVDGGSGVDTMEADGTFASETVRLFASSGHLIIDHDLRDQIDADNLTVFGTAGVDHIVVNGSGASITVAGLATTVTPVNLDRQDFLTIDALAGVDTVDSSGLQRGLVQLRVL